MDLRNNPLTKGYKYFYTTLSPKDQAAYSALYGGILQLEDAITAPLPEGEVKPVMEALMNDNPLIFWFGEYTATLYSDHMILEPRYLISKEEIVGIVDKLSRNVEALYRQVEKADALEQERFFHDYLVRNCPYNDQFPHYSFMGVGPLVYGSGVCQGISRAFKLLCDRADIPCIVTGGLTDTHRGAWEDHAWNKVFMNGKFYNVDVTFDNGRSKNLPYVDYRYFNVSDRFIERDRREIPRTVYCGE